jgi:hypothetical protein
MSRTGENRHILHDLFILNHVGVREACSNNDAKLIHDNGFQFVKSRDVHDVPALQQALPNARHQIGASSEYHGVRSPFSKPIHGFPEGIGTKILKD